MTSELPNMTGVCTTRCIVFAPSGAMVDERLRSQPQARSWRLSAHEDPRVAMAELCLQEKAQASRASWGLRRAERLALVLVVPEGGVDDTLEGELAGLVSAVQRYLPAIPIWLLDEEELSLIARGAPAANPPPERPRPVQTPRPEGSVAQAGPTDLHLTEAAAPDAAPVEFEPEEMPDDEPTQITAEEIEMLLARDADEASAR